MKDTYVEFVRSQYHVNFSNVSRHDIHLFAWVNVYNEPHQHEVHHHVKSRLSGTYYVDVNKTTEPIKFWNPNLHQFTRNLVMIDNVIRLNNMSSQVHLHIKQTSSFFQKMVTFYCAFVSYALSTTGSPTRK